MKKIADMPDTYRPNQLLDICMERLGVKTDAALCKILGIAPPVISKVRHKVLMVGDSLLLDLHDATGLTADELRELMGTPRVRV